jgi:hypothetical protein
MLRSAWLYCEEQARQTYRADQDSQPSEASTMPAFEYRRVYVYMMFEDADFDKLNALGAKGWRVIHVFKLESDAFRIILERRRQGGQDA